MVKYLNNNESHPVHECMLVTKDIFPIFLSMINKQQLLRESQSI